MEFALPSLRYLALEYKRKPFDGSVLTLGRQYVFATYDQVVDMLRSEGIQPAKLDADLTLTTNIPNWKKHSQSMHNTSDVVFFKPLGLDVFAMDISDYENCDFVLDLNNLIPDELEDRFGLIIDGGTMEHVFNTKHQMNMQINETNLTYCPLFWVKIRP